MPGEEVDHALGVAVRVLNERIELCRHMSENARTGGRTMGVTHWERLKKEAQEEFQVLQQFLDRAPLRAIAENGDRPALAAQDSRGRKQA